MNLAAYFRQHRIYLALVGFFIIGAAYFLANFSKAEIHLFINQHHAPWADIFFAVFTHIGDGLIFPVLLIPFLFVKRHYSLGLIISALSTLAISGAIKQYYKEEPRPIKYFELIDQELRQIPGVKPHYYRSFPSGHTTAAFAAFGLVALSIGRLPWQLVCIIIAIGAAYSRMYLSMHFLRDVTAGAVLGTFIAFFAAYFSQRMQSQFWNKKWINLS
jgi:membrane-associated phospholipid phosphatase